MQYSLNPVVSVAQTLQFIRVVSIHGTAHIVNLAHISSTKVWPEYVHALVNLADGDCIEVDREQFLQLQQILDAFTTNLETPLALPAEESSNITKN